MEREFRTGLGYDIHRLEKGEYIILGGIRIPCELSIVAHSDGDLLFHAIADSLLGATGQGDIGKHFPPTDIKWKDISGTDLVLRVVKLTKPYFNCIVNIDTVIKAQKPRLAEYQEKIRNSIAKILDLEISRVNVKIKSAEGLGPVGEGKAIEAFSTIMIRTE